MRFVFHPDAEEEFNKAIDYYEELQNGLSARFANEVYLTIQRILSFPKAWSILEDDIRRCLCNKFPFGIIYYQQDQTIVILAVMELHQDPNYWKSRV